MIVREPPKPAPARYTGLTVLIGASMVWFGLRHNILEAFVPGITILAAVVLSAAWSVIVSDGGH